MTYDKNKQTLSNCLSPQWILSLKTLERGALALEYIRYEPSAEVKNSQSLHPIVGNRWTGTKPSYPCHLWDTKTIILRGIYLHLLQCSFIIISYRSPFPSHNSTIKRSLFISQFFFFLQFWLYISFVFLFFPLTIVKGKSPNCEIYFFYFFIYLFYNFYF